MNRDLLTYRYPRTSIQAFGCDAQEAIAVQVFRPSVFARILRGLMDYGCLVMAIAGLAYIVGQAGWRIDTDKIAAEEVTYAAKDVAQHMKVERAEQESKK